MEYVGKCSSCGGACVLICRSAFNFFFNLCSCFLTVDLGIWLEHRHWPHGIFTLMDHCSLCWLCQNMNGCLFWQSLKNTSDIQCVVWVVLLLVGYLSHRQSLYRINKSTVLGGLSYSGRSSHSGAFNTYQLLTAEQANPRLTSLSKEEGF